MDNIMNKNVLITGAASGLGYTYAEKLLQNKAKAVAILDLSTSSGATSAATLEKKFGKGKATFYPCDVTNITQFEETFKKAVKALNGIDIVINNAGMCNDKKWQETVNLNVGGVIQGSLLAIDAMGKHKGGKGGILINIASIAGFKLFPAIPVYCGTKYNVLAFSRCLEANYNKTGVNVLVMCPGVTETALLSNMESTVLDFVDLEDVRVMFDNLPTQTVENVGVAMVNLIQKGKNGSVWVSEGEQPPYAIEFPPVTKVEINL